MDIPGVILLNAPKHGVLPLKAKTTNDTAITLDHIELILSESLLEPIDKMRGWSNPVLPIDYCLFLQPESCLFEEQKNRVKFLRPCFSKCDLFHLSFRANAT